MSIEQPEITHKTVEPLLMAGIRARGKFEDCGQYFKRLGKKFGFKICGPAFMLYWDEEYKADDADYEVCMSIRKGEGDDEISVREFPGGQCVSLIHFGPYENLKESYDRILCYCHDNAINIYSPIREVYLKGPGMIFKGNPKKYRTEIQIFYTDCEQSNNEQSCEDHSQTDHTTND